MPRLKVQQWPGMQHLQLASVLVSGLLGVHAVVAEGCFLQRPVCMCLPELCAAVQDASKGVSFKAFPFVLFLQLKRFEFV